MYNETMCYYYLININAQVHQFYEKYVYDPHTVLAKYFKSPASPGFVT